VKGHADVIVKDGQPLADHLLRHNISCHDLEEQLRLHGFERLSDVHLAYKERNGEVSIIPQK